MYLIIKYVHIIYIYILYYIEKLEICKLWFFFTMHIKITYC